MKAVAAAWGAGSRTPAGARRRSSAEAYQSWRGSLDGDDLAMPAPTLPKAIIFMPSDEPNLNGAAPSSGRRW